jgi:Oxidoreductase molybdopterin binding domain
MTDEEQVQELNEEVKHSSRRRTRRSFLAAAIAAAGGYEFYRWIDRNHPDQMIPGVLRRGLNLDEAVSKNVFGDRGLAPTYPLKDAEELRVNGVYGLKEELVPESWRLQMVGVEQPRRLAQYVDDVTAWQYRYAAKKDEKDSGNHDTKVAPKAAMMGPSPDQVEKAADAGNASLPPEFQRALEELKKTQGNKRPRGKEEAGESANTLEEGTPGLLLTMEDVTRFPKQELVTQFKCIEGWSQVVHWGGVRLGDLLEAYPPARGKDGRLPQYVYMETPDGDYYCGYDLKACMHPQSLLVTEMMGRPLNQWHGAPLRLHMPIKYGYKQIKRIGLIAYTDMRPDDYWTKLGYDWYAGL